MIFFVWKINKVIILNYYFLFLYLIMLIFNLYVILLNLEKMILMNKNGY